jgi:hypothetical protein
MLVTEAQQAAAARAAPPAAPRPDNTQVYTLNRLNALVRAADAATSRNLRTSAVRETIPVIRRLRQQQPSAWLELLASSLVSTSGAVQPGHVPTKRVQ